MASNLAQDSFQAGSIWLPSWFKIAEVKTADGNPPRVLVRDPRAHLKGPRQIHCGGGREANREEEKGDEEKVGGGRKRGT
eukprot:7086485-Pyramimonas_sp.AAC.1